METTAGTATTAILKNNFKWDNDVVWKLIVL